MSNCSHESAEAWRVRGTRSDLSVYHTDPECRALPDNPMPINPENHPDLVECQYCAGEYDNSGKRDFSIYNAAKEAGQA